MPRLNLTLDADTDAWLSKHARQDKTMRASLARDILREGIARREKLARLRKLAADYAADRKDATTLLADLEPGELELLGDDANA